MFVCDCARCEKNAIEKQQKKDWCSSTFVFIDYEFNSISNFYAAETAAPELILHIRNEQAAQMSINHTGFVAHSDKNKSHNIFGQFIVTVWIHFL